LVLLVWLFYFLKLARCRGFSGRKYNYTKKTDLLILTHYLLTPVAYFPIIVRNFLKRFFWYRTLFWVRYGLFGKDKSKLDEQSANILRLGALKVPKTIIAKQYGCSVGNLYNFLNRMGNVT